ncbi:Major facilitator superfamily MFS_1 [Paraburkholderia ribeironis]|uniref:Major facilitator superfamily MFS_1 n=1 Tax=Paraburkholderia ribeironis TaxID=1247936 RepID=A0A1N7S8K2_9BURK|nr:MFS transporter [Paraburkholderia ribeironis]SIT43726.1 Major facilitator superfamily MFS_1 [Paraburkholderia ribeironis]
MIEANQSRRARYAVFALLYLGYCISYIDRSAIALSLVAIGKEFNVGSAALGVVMSTFFIGYAAMQIPGGWIADRWGSKRVIVASVVFWSLFTLLTGLAWSLASLIAIRFIFGLGEGGYPGAAIKGVTESCARVDRPKMTALLMSSNYVGSFIAPLVIAPLILLLGWRYAFVVAGVAGVVFALVYLFAVKDTSAARGAAGNSKRVDGAATRALLKMPLMWKILITWFGMGIVSKGLDAWMPAYLLAERHLDLKSVGMLTPLPFVAASISTALAGWIFTRWFDGREKWLMAACCAISGFFLYEMYTAETVTGVIAYQSIVYFFKSFVFAGVFALPTRFLPQKLMGTGAGMVNFGGQVAGFVAPVVIGLLVSITGNYDAVFGFLIAATLLALGGSLSIRLAPEATRRLATMEEA